MELRLRRGSRGGSRRERERERGIVLEGRAPRSAEGQRGEGETTRPEALMGELEDGKCLLERGERS
eukprot:3377536-Rhodomonas_salina.1